MEKINLQHQYPIEEIAEEFGTHRPMIERDINARIDKKEKVKKEGKQDEKAKKLRSKSKNPS